MATPRQVFAKRWRIESVDGWEKSAVNLLGPAYIEFGRTGKGEFQVLAITGDIDYRVASESDRPIIEWSWMGDDDGTDTLGRGWAYLESGSLLGRIFIHCGDELNFVAASTRPRRLRRG